MGLALAAVPKGHSPAAPGTSHVLACASTGAESKSLCTALGHGLAWPLPSRGPELAAAACARSSGPLWLDLHRSLGCVSVAAPGSAAWLGEQAQGCGAGSWFVV